MGDVCLAVLVQARGARDLCVVKRLGAADGPRRELLARFKREVAIASQMSHGAIARTLEFGEHDGELYLVEEFIEGTDLADLPRKKIGVALAVHIVREVSRALDYVHEFHGMGLVHRDVAPANIRLGSSGQVKLLDFGLATAPEFAALTRQGQFWGRATYSAPESRSGLRADRRADVYSLGVVLWELLAGRALLEESVPTSTGNPAVPHALEELVARAVAIRPEARIESAKALREALDPFVPTTFDGPAEVRAVVEKSAELIHGRRMVEIMLEDARSLLEDKEAAEATAPIRPQGSKRSPVLTAAAGLGMLFLVVGGVVLLKGRAAEPAKQAIPPTFGPTSPATARSLALEPSRPVSVPAALPKGTPGPEVAAAHHERLPTKRRAPPEERASRPSGVMRNKAHSSPTIASDESRAMRATATIRNARLRFGAGDLVAAEELAREAVSLDGGASAHFLLGQIFFARGSFEEAAKCYGDVLRLEPENQAAARNLAESRAALRRVARP